MLLSTEISKAQRSWATQCESLASSLRAEVPKATQALKSAHQRRHRKHVKSAFLIAKKRTKFAEAVLDSSSGNLDRLIGNVRSGKAEIDEDTPALQMESKNELDVPLAAPAETDPVASPVTEEHQDEKARRGGQEQAARQGGAAACPRR